MSRKKKKQDWNLKLVCEHVISLPSKTSYKLKQENSAKNFLISGMKLKEAGLNCEWAVKKWWLATPGKNQQSVQNKLKLTYVYQKSALCR